MRADRERQVEAKRRAAKEEATRMESERQAAVMKRLIEFSFRLCKIDLSLDFSL